jgi:hypothetical protein
MKSMAKATTGRTKTPTTPRKRITSRVKPDADQDLSEPLDSHVDEPMARDDFGDSLDSHETTAVAAPPVRTNTHTDTVGGIDAETNAKYEEIKRGDVYIKELQRMNVAELHELAKQENLNEYTGLKKQDLIFNILKARINRNGLMYGEGVLEILPDGFGFLRSPEYN